MKKDIKLFTIMFTLCLFFVSGFLDVNALSVDEKQETLASCLTTNGNTCVLSEDILLSAQIVIPSGVEVVLDLNGKSISPAANLKLNGGMLVVTNGAKLTVNDSVGTGAIETKDTTVYGALQAGDTRNYNPSLKSIIIVNGGIMEGYYSGIVGNGTVGNTEIVVNDGIIRCTNIESSCTAIYHPQQTVVNGDERIISTLTINGGTVTGGTGIGMRGGKLVVNDGTIIGQYEETIVIPSANGTTTFGVGIGISQHTTKSEVQIEINGGTIKGSTALYESNTQKNSAEDIKKVTISITGGTFEKINLGEVAIYSENNKEFITGGTFNVDAKDYIPTTGYESKLMNNVYVVGKVHKINKDVTSGTISVNKETAIANEKIEFEATPLEGYELSSMLVLDANGEEIVVSDNSFTMPNSDVTIKVVFTKTVIDVPEIDTTKEVENVEIGVLDADDTEKVLADSLKADTETQKKIEDKDVTVTIEVEKLDDSKIDADVKSNIENEVGENAILEYFDISVVVKDSADDKLANITDLTEMVQLTVLLPESFINNDENTTREYFVIREHNGEVEVLDATLSDNGKYIVFESDKFSTYAIGYEDTVIEEPPVGDEEIENPKTGDSIIMHILLALISAVIFSITLCTLRKEMQNNN